jgi:hypothetical protein
MQMRNVVAWSQVKRLSLKKKRTIYGKITAFMSMSLDGLSLGDDPSPTANFEALDGSLTGCSWQN